MARYEILDEAGTVINTIIADQAFVEQHYTGGRFRLAEEPELPAGPEPVPQVVSRFQARAAMMGAAALDPAYPHLLAQIDAIVAGAGDPFAKLAWEEAIEFRRDSPTVTALAAGAGLGDAELDQLFRAAAQITA